MNDCHYVLITPARNEESFINTTIQSVVAQSILPVKWLIVNDGSTDKTVEIVNSYAEKYNFIHLIDASWKTDRSFSSKSRAFMLGYKMVRDIDFEFIGCLDADISFESCYVEFLLDRLGEDKNLGVVGTPYIENGYSSASDSFEGDDFVNGAFQLFRKECFEEIGGYKESKSGGIDWIAVTSARMKGWKTRSYSEKYFVHYRPAGTAESSIFSALYRIGKKDYYLGNHPLWQLGRILYRSTKQPYMVGGLLILLGYLSAAFSKNERSISEELMRFHRTEQLDRLKKIFLGRV